MLEELKAAQKNYDKGKARRLNEQIAILYWVLGEGYTIPSMEDVTLNYDKFRELSPCDMARFLGLDTDGEERSVCTVCATLDNCHGGCLLGVLTWFTQRVTTDEWVKLLKKKGIRK